ncbi:MAG: dihydroneopterin aldolase [Thermomicrobiales bacterium]|nr:dihydroneopterin aldolase [Thermomicrobiales bacterium]
MTDAILLEGLRFFGYHGRSPEERTLGQQFVVDVVAELDLRNAGLHDEIDETVGYHSLSATVRSVLEGEPLMLIEAVGDRVARLVLETFPAITAVEVTVRKPEATIRGAHLDAVGVRIRRVRAHLRASQPVDLPDSPIPFKKSTT